MSISFTVQISDGSPSSTSTTDTMRESTGQADHLPPSSPTTRTVSGASARGGIAELERRQAERRKEMMRPKAPTQQTRQALIEKLEETSASPKTRAVVRVPKGNHSPGSGSNVKQMLLDWCRAKTRMYENVSIQNFSSSWGDGLAFCALLHSFFPHAFDYSALEPQNRRHNFQMAFRAAERLVDCPPLLDVEDMVLLEEPDWKCVYTYIQELYRALVQRGLVKTKKSGSHTSTPP